MKHINKKYQYQQNIEIPLDHSMKGFFEPGNLTVLKESYKKKNVLIQTENNDIILGFIYNNSGNYISVALPDFTLVYFDFAYSLNIRRKEIQKTLLNKLSKPETLTEDRSKELYEFFGVSTSCIINLFTSIESFINHLLPDDKSYVLELNSKTEIYNKVQIQENISFMDKLKNVLPQFYGKSFF